MSGEILKLITAGVPALQTRWAAIEASSVQSDDLPSVRAGHLASAYVALFEALTPDLRARIGRNLEEALRLANREDMEVIVDGFIEGVQNLVLRGGSAIATEDVSKTLLPLGQEAWRLVNQVWRGEATDAVSMIIGAREGRDDESGD